MSLEAHYRQRAHDCEARLTRIAQLVGQYRGLAEQADNPLCTEALAAIRDVVLAPDGDTR